MSTIQLSTHKFLIVEGDGTCKIEFRKQHKPIKPFWLRSPRRCDEPFWILGSDLIYKLLDVNLGCIYNPSEFSLTDEYVLRFYIEETTSKYVAWIKQLHNRRQCLLYDDQFRRLLRCLRLIQTGDVNNIK